jgi:hypothetical protein
MNYTLGNYAEEVLADDKASYEGQDITDNNVNVPLVEWKLPISQPLMQHGLAEMARIVNALQLVEEGPIRVIQGL